MSAEKPQTIYRRDYREPDYWVHSIDLHFDLGEDETLVRTRTAFRRNDAIAGDPPPLVLVGEELELLEVRLGDRTLAARDYHVSEDSLRIEDVPPSFELETLVRIKPQDNTTLSGLYRSGGLFCTQCEAMGFRRITYSLDRPDVMALFTTTIEADRTRYPVLLSNGNRVLAEDLPDGRHRVRWEDPFRKPSYLFALVAGDLRCHAGSFTTRSKREVWLEIWVEPENIESCEHALRSLSKAMKWDEERYGLEYDLDIYMIVAVNDFNMGAMENKGLNVFNSKYVLARPETATDDEYEAIEGVIAHEYFHNWTGNRVTCRDWFQLTLKEGLTVYRDQTFSADMGSAAVTRIADVKRLRFSQFSEDAGPMAHPIRPESYISMDNFYTPTVYEKGAEVIRMYATLASNEGFRAGMDLYFERHDGQAVTCDDFRAAIADANDLDLELFERWYTQAGTPVVHASGEYAADSQSYRLTLRQSEPERFGTSREDEEAWQPQHVPVTVGLLGRDGRDLPLRLVGEASASGTSRVLELVEEERTFAFVDVDQPVVPSVLRGFSAPVRLVMERSGEELAFLMANDSDPFNRWEAGQELAKNLLLSLAGDNAAGRPLKADPLFVEAFGKILADPELDGSLKSLALALPGEKVLGQEQKVIDVDALHAAREWLRGELARSHRDALEATYEASAGSGPYSIDQASIGRRRMRNTCLAYLVALSEPETIALAARQFERADNMTDSQAALSLLVDFDGKEREAALEAFYERWREDPLVLDKWFSVQALSKLPDAAKRVAALSEHADFSLRNPNRTRSLVAVFCGANQVRFHGADGAGYSFLADTVLELDDMNPQVASRLVSNFNAWKRFDEGRQQKMKTELERIAAKKSLSKDVFEIVTRALA